MSNPTQEYNDYIRANLPLGITYDEVRARYVTDNGKYFPTYLEAKWYLDYIIKFGFIPSPASLFANGEQGAWYDPSDLTTLYQDAAGTTPVTADGDPVGLMLDKSQGLKRGPELVDSSVGVADSSFVDRGTQTHIDGDVWELETTSTSETEFGVVTATPNGFFDTTKFYEIVVTVDLFDVSDSGHVLSLRFSRGQNSRVTSAFLSISDTGVYYVRTKANRDTLTFRTDGGTATIGDKIRLSISVRELPGNHATQSTAAARPVYRTDGALHWLEFDGVDDVLFASQKIDKLEFTYSAGFLTNKQFADQILVDSFEDSSREWARIGSEDGDIVLIVDNNGDKEYLRSGPVNSGERHILTGTYAASAGDMRLYQDNDLLVSGNIGTRDKIEGREPEAIGGNFLDTAEFLNGNIYTAFFMDRVLTSQERQNLAAYMAQKSGVSL